MDNRPNRIGKILIVDIGIDIQALHDARGILLSECRDVDIVITDNIRRARLLFGDGHQISAILMRIDKEKVHADYRMFLTSIRLMSSAYLYLEGKNFSEADMLDVYDYGADICFSGYREDTRRITLAFLWSLVRRIRNNHACGITLQMLHSHKMYDSILLRFHKDISVNPQNQTVTVRGSAVKVNPKEYDLLCFLGRNADKIHSNANIAKNVWESESTTANEIYITISRLRKVIEWNPQKPQIIKTLYKRGYIFISSQPHPAD